MKTFWGITFVLIISLALQSAWFSGLNPRPNGILAATLAMAILRGPLVGALTGFCGGFLEDTLSGSQGGFAIIGLTLGWLLGLLFRGTYSKNIIIILFAMLAGSLIYFIFARTLAFDLGSAVDSKISFSLIGWLLIQGFLGWFFLICFDHLFSSDVIEV